MLSGYLWKGFSALWGTFNLAAFYVYALLEGAVFQKPTRAEQKELAAGT